MFVGADAVTVIVTETGDEVPLAFVAVAVNV
jgi:hypothetical protein